MSRYSVKTPEGVEVKNPAIVRFIFNDPRMAIFWTVIRVLAGIKWLQIAVPKLSNPGWMEGGAVVRGFWSAQVTIPEAGPPPIVYSWYRDFIQGLLDSGAYEWMAPLIVITEITIGVMLVLGAFVGFTAIAAILLQWMYILAGSAGNSGLLFPAAFGLLAAWKIAGIYGLDYFLMRRVSGLWSPKPETFTPPQTQTT